MLNFLMAHPRATPEMLGIVPEFLDESDPRTAREQFDANYGPIGGGWRPQAKWSISHNAAHYPGDPPRPLIAYAYLREEEIRFFAGARVAIVQPDGSFEMATID